MFAQRSLCDIEICWSFAKEKIRCEKWGALATLSLAMFIIVIDTTIMNVSISNLVVDLNTTVSGVQAAISIYALVMAAFMLIGGKLADIFGPNCKENE